MSLGRKWLIVYVISAGCFWCVVTSSIERARLMGHFFFSVTACSSMVVRSYSARPWHAIDSHCTQASTYPGVMKEFPNPGALALRSRPCWCSSYVLCGFVLIAFSPSLNLVIIGPLSEFYGRTPIYVLSLFFFLVRPFSRLSVA